MSGVKGRSGVYQRSPEWIATHSGPNNYNWKGGIKVLRKKEYMREYLKAYWQRYRLEKPEIVQHNRWMHRERIRNAEGTHSKEEWEAKKAEFDQKCANCGLATTLTRDHIIPLAKGGSNDIANIQPLCRSCNCSKKDKIIDVSTKAR